jgi:hypothetical protein
MWYTQDRRECADVGFHLSCSHLPLSSWVLHVETEGTQPPGQLSEPLSEQVLLRMPGFFISVCDFIPPSWRTWGLCPQLTCNLSSRAWMVHGEKETRTIKDPSVHMELEAQQPREHRGLRNNGGYVWESPPGTEVYLSEITVTDRYGVPGLHWIFHRTIPDCM